MKKSFLLEGWDRGIKYSASKAFITIISFDVVTWRINISISDPIRTAEAIIRGHKPDSMALMIAESFLRDYRGDLSRDNSELVNKFIMAIESYYQIALINEYELLTTSNASSK